MIPFNVHANPAMAYLIQELAARRDRVIPRVWEGQTVVVAGSGPSLTKSDLDFVCGRAPVIVVNRTYQIAPWADVLFAADLPFWRVYRPEFSGWMVSTSIIPPWVFPGVTHIKSVTLWEGLSLDPHFVADGASGFMAINLAVLMGAKTILLLGFDGKRAEGKAHFFGDHERGLTNPVAGQFFRWNRDIETLPPYLARAGVEVINCSRDTAITAFPRMTIEEALPWLGLSNAAE